MHPPRSGSAILLCLGLATIAVMVGFAFLRAISRQDISGTSEIIEGLARDAARSGLTHATEQIMADFNATSLKVVVNMASATVAPVPTHLDGPYRAPFASLAKPGLLLDTQTGGANGTDDVQEENHLLMPFIKKDSDGAPSRTAEAWFYDLGLMIYEGRGRYYEPGYYDTTRPDPAVANPVPVTTVRFTDAAAAATERNAPLFLDRNLRRLTGASVTERALARYRVRYAVGVEDLQGHLLANPRADMDLDWGKTTWGDDHYRSSPPWLNAAGYVWNSMTSCVFGGYPSVPLRMDHIFRGRGMASNADRAWVTGAANGMPAAFPYMFRSLGRERDRFNAGVPFHHSVDHNQWWGNFTWGGTWSHGTDADGVFDGTLVPHSSHTPPCTCKETSVPANRENMGGRLYRHTGTIAGLPSYPRIDPNPAGGQLLTPVSDTAYPYVHALLGPQISWYNHLSCLQGWANDFGANADWTGQQSYYLTSYSPFGRRMREAATTSGQKWYEGPVDNPWLVNALTATPQTVNQMLLAYLPPYLKTLKWTHEDWYLKTGETVSTDADGNIHVNDVFGPAVDHTVNGPWERSMRGLETLNDQLGSGFADFPAPSSTETVSAPYTPQTITIKPDYYQDNPEPRPIEQRYPGPLSRGDSTVADQGSDDLGQYIDADSRGIGRCTHIGKPFMFLGGSDEWRIEEVDIIDPGTNWRRKWRICRRIDTLTYKYRFSYFWDLSYGLTQALAFARATWVQYPNSFFTPSTAFNPSSLRDPRPHDTLAEFDRLFLRQLGENYDNPGSPCPDEPIQQVSTATGASWDAFSISYAKAASKPPHTIASLKASALLQTASGVSSAERAKVMERMLNDFRLSFLGCSPAYRSSFRPLDFDGDHQVQCSAYDINTAASADEKKYKTARWKADDGAGRGPALAGLGTAGVDYPTGFSNNPWFCATGAFFIGKSHYYRIFVRGEVFDNLLNKPISARTLESVLAVDPEATIDPHDGARPAGNQPYTRVLFQRWHHNDQTSELPRHVR